MKKSLLIFFLLALSEMAFSQNQHRVADSLIQILKTAQEDTAKVNILNTISRSLGQVGDYDKALSYAKDALLLAQKINFKTGITKAYNNAGIVYTRLGNYPEALKNDFASLKMQEEMDDKHGISYSYYTIGIIYLDQSNYPEALKNYLVALKIADEINDKRIIACSFNGMGNVYINQQNYTEALKNYLKMLKAAEDYGDKQIIAYAHGNIGNVYKDQNRYTEALENYTVTLKIEKEIGDKLGIAISYINLGELSMKLNKRDEAREYLNNALKLSEEIGGKEQIQQSYLQMSRMDSITGNFTEAYKYLRLYSNMKDSVLNEKSDKQISQLKIQYESERKDKEIALLNSENKIETEDLDKQRIIKYVGFSFAVLILLIAILVFNYITIKNKSRQLIKANEIRQRISRDLHDEIGSGLSRLSLISQVAMQYQHDKQKLNENLLKLKSVSQKLSREMNEMIWKVNPTYDTLESTLGYIRNYAGELLEENNIEYEINFPEQIKDVKVSTDFRRNIYSMSKEVLNNVIKHARATKMCLTFNLSKDGVFEYTLSDNGCGFDMEKRSLFRNGLKNMKQRADEIGVRFKLESIKEGGTVIILDGEVGLQLKL